MQHPERMRQAAAGNDENHAHTEGSSLRPFPVSDLMKFKLWVLVEPLKCSDKGVVFSAEAVNFNWPYFCVPCLFLACVCV